MDIALQKKAFVQYLLQFQMEVFYMFPQDMHFSRLIYYFILIDLLEIDILINIFIPKNFHSSFTLLHSKCIQSNSAVLILLCTVLILISIISYLIRNSLLAVFFIFLLIFYYLKTDLLNIL